MVYRVLRDYMKQLSFFEEIEKQAKPTRKKQGRPNAITPEIVFCVLEELKSKKTNKYIIEKYNLSERTFFRIKKGDYPHLLKKHLDTELENFSLSFGS
jgi:hypothetical protein